MKQFMQEIGWWFVPVVFMIITFITAAVATSEPDPPRAVSGKSQDQIRLDRRQDGYVALYARKVPGGCLYIAERTGLAFAPFECAKLSSTGQ